MADLIERFLSTEEYVDFDGVCDGSGNGVGYGYGYGNGCGYGYGCGGDGSAGNGYGCGSGNDYGNGYGYGYGYGCGDDGGAGNGYGCGYGYGYDDGNGYGYGYGCYIRTFNNNQVYIIDNTETVIESIHNNIAKGYVLQKDLTLQVCFIAKIGNCFAHGQTIKQAVADAQDKYLQNRPIEERLVNFNTTFPNRDKKIPAKELYKWHNILTGSCEMGRQQFCKDHKIDIDKDLFTVNEFIALTTNEYGGNIIKQLCDTH